MQYNSIETCLNSIKRDLFPKKNRNELSKLTAREIYREFYCQNDGLVLYAALGELVFSESNKLSIFPNSNELIDTMLNAKLGDFDFNLIKPPSNTFAVVMPRGYKSPDGILIPSFIVNWFKLSKMQNFMTEVLQSDVFSQCVSKESMERASKSELSITVSSYDVKSRKINFQIASDDEIYEIQKYKPVGVANSESQNIDYTVMKNTMIKIAIAIAVFNSAYKNFLSKGLPKGAKIGKLTGGFISSSVIMGNDLAIPSSHRSSHLRCFHFRQLRHPKYYKGEYSDQPIGSRWIPVSETWVGDDIDAYTAKNLN